MDLFCRVGVGSFLFRILLLSLSNSPLPPGLQLPPCPSAGRQGGRLFGPMGRQGFVPAERALGVEMSAPRSDNEAFCPPAAAFLSAESPSWRERSAGGALPGSAPGPRGGLPARAPPAPAAPPPRPDCGLFPSRLCLSWHQVQSPGALA